ncbi:MAG TPA: 1,4-alpha-glucan branching protein GlgB [Vicinamibacterales bacterium]|nr:1,4-alpha-glucan branching protein GlgB [Vicinamibacterales bacterium]
MLTEFDLHLFNEGTLHRAYEKLGAHQREVDGQLGVHFAVWAPNADKVSVIGDFNGWNPASHPMRSLGVSGIWEIFVPNVGDGERYKYEIRSREGAHLQKADPYGVFFESDASGAAIVWNLDRYTWRDKAWLDERTRSNGWLDRPLSVYELHLGSWKRVPERGGGPLTYREMAEQIVPYVKDLGYTHIELMPVLEHPFAGSWGYQVTGFFAPTSRFGPPEDFKAFVDECHVNGIAVILDWVPGHFPKDAHGLARFDGTALYEHEDPRQGEHRDWGTLIFNYGRHEVRAFLLSSALFWLEEYHIDGLRVDAVASMLYLDYSREDGDWLPNQYGGRENLEAMEFLRQLNVQTHAHYPGTITVAEESTAWPGVTRPVHLGGLGFTYKWNMGWMHDMLQYASKDPIYRRWSHNDLTFSLLYAFTENFILPFSHDEVVHGKRAMLDKMPGDIWQKRATLRALYGYMYGHPGKKLMFMGCEFGQWREWGHDESLDWHLLQYAEHRGIQHWVRDLNRTLKEQPALHQVDFDHTGFEWIDCSDFEGSVVSFIRRAHHSSDFVLVAVNFTPVVRHDYVIGVPEAGRYVELLNSDGEIYGGGNLGNSGVIQSEPTPAHGRPHRLSLVLPPLACLILKRE